MELAKDRQDFYSVVRIAPDQIRQEFANVGVVLATKGLIVLRMLPEASAVLRAVGPPSSKELLDRLPELIASRLAVRLDASTEIGLPGQPNKSRLAHVFIGTIPPFRDEELSDLLGELRGSGMSGVWFTEAELVVSDATRETPVDVVDELYDELVRPRRWPWGPASRGGRLDAHVRRYIRETVKRNALNVAAGLELRSPWGSYDFPVAYANGAITLVQAIDLDVTVERQQANTRTAIAVHAETDALLSSLAPEVQWLSVVKSGPDSSVFTERLRHFSSQIVSEGDVDGLTLQIEQEGSTPVEAFFRRRGFLATRHDSMVEVFAELPVTPSDRSAH